MSRLLGEAAAALAVLGLPRAVRATRLPETSEIAPPVTQEARAQALDRDRAHQQAMRVTEATAPKPQHWPADGVTR